MLLLLEAEEAEADERFIPPGPAPVAEEAEKAEEADYVGVEEDEEYE